MNNWTRFGLVLLRVVIGWHFLFEGVEKLESWYAGPHEGHAAWSAAGYLSEAQGPLAPWFRKQAGDPDGEALTRLPLPEEAGKLPAAVENDWKAQFERFDDHYKLGKKDVVQPENIGTVAVSVGVPFPAAVPWPALARSLPRSKHASQLALAREDQHLALARALIWLNSGSREVPSKLPGVAEKVKETTPERIVRYRKTLEKIREIEIDGMPAFDRDVWKDNYRALKKDAVVQRTELLRDLNKPFTEAMAIAKFRLDKSQRDKGPVPEPEVATTNLDRINFVTRWGLAIVGACLILGLFTRLSCIAGAGFLLMFYLAAPALPWLPESPRSEGHYLFINKNIIEMIALLALATTQSGKWVGLDGLLQFLNPLTWRRSTP